MTRQKLRFLIGRAPLHGVAAARAVSEETTLGRGPTRSTVLRYQGRVEVAGSQPRKFGTHMPKAQCRYLAGGLAFRYGTVASCGVVHHNRGTPPLLEYNGGPVPFDELIERRAAIADGSDPSCSGCPNLGDLNYPESEYPVTWLGITHFNFCNVSCNYCWLETSSHSPRNTGRRENPYPILPIVKKLLDEKLLAPDAIIDWGGGGEPTIMPGFDESFALLEEYGAIQWLHSNAVRIPPRAQRPGMKRSHVRILCSLDSGNAETYKALKAKDYYDRVVANLETYVKNGAYVAIKYIMVDRNCSFAEIDRCLERLLEIGAAEFIPDIDYDKPQPTEEIVRGLAYAKLRCQELRIPFQLGSTGINSAPEYMVQHRVQNEFYRLSLEALEV